MYGNTPNQWSGSLKGYKRLRFIINCLTRMRMLDRDLRLNFTHSGPPWPAHKNLLPWYRWSALGLIVLPDLLSLDTGCVWGRQLTAVRLDKRLPRVIQVDGQR
jgi:bis(5'-nucleosyl)-tetraphosphatase (symmetrical)